MTANVKWSYFLIDGEKYYNTRSIYEKLKGIGNDKKFVYEREYDHIKLIVSDRCVCHDDYKRTLVFFIETNFSEQKKFNKIKCGKNGIRNLIHIGKQFTTTMILTSDEQIFDVSTDYNFEEYIENKKTPLTILEETIWKIHRLK
jgi:hypothetical protein